MGTNIITDPDFAIIKRKITNFLESQPSYTLDLKKQVENGRNRLIVNLNDLRAFDLPLAQKIISSPIKYIPPFEAALFDLATEIFSSTPKKPKNTKNQKKLRTFHVGFEGSLGENFVAPRDFGSSFLTQLVSVEGIVTRLSSVRPKRLETVHFCEKTKSFSSTLYRDATSFDQEPTGSTIPQKDAEGNQLTLEFGYSTYIDHQKLYLQDMPERSTAGQMPRTVEVICENDLVDTCKAGDRVQIVGVYRALAWKTSGQTNGIYKTVLIANNIKVINQLSRTSRMTNKDIKNIKKLSKRRNLLSLFGNSIAPNLFGHSTIKKAIALLLLGGVEKILENKTHIRGDINMLLIGDPSVGKSQLLRSVMQIARLSVSTTGKGSTGVGLTAAVLKDRETGNRYLEAGATVLADKGVLCIDEFDKMSEIDRTAIHEVMEQQTVTIAKAGIHTSLNARCSVVAAANPVYSSYDSNKTPQQNIPLPDSILSRFDVLFVVLDKLSSENDRLVSDHVLKVHRLEEKSTDQIDIYDRIDDADEAEEETEVFEKPGKFPTKMQKRSQKNRNRKFKDKKDILSIGFLRKYLEYAKATYHPVLTDDANKKIAEVYCEIRNRDDVMTLPITARYVETIIRFATAHSKLRLSDEVKKSDVEAVLEILYESLGCDRKEGEESQEEKEVFLEEKSVSDEKSASEKENIDIAKKGKALKRKRKDKIERISNKRKR